MANGATLTAEEFTNSVAEQIASQLKIQPDVLVSRLVDALSKGLIKKFVGKPIAQAPIKQQDSKPQEQQPNKETEDQPLVNNKAIEQTIVTKIPRMVEKLTEIADLISNVFDNRSGITRQEKFPDILKSSFEKLTKNIDTTTKTVIDFNEEGEEAEGVEPTEKETFLEKKDEIKPVLIAGFTPQGFEDFKDKLPIILKELFKQPKEKKEKIVSETESPEGGGLLSMIPKGLLSILGGAGLILGGLGALVGAFMTDGPAKGTLELLGKAGIKGGLILLAKKLFGATLKTVLKRIPIIGTLISYGFAIQRFSNGDTIGGIVDLASGTIQLLDLVAPGLGTVLSLGVDILQAVLDAKAGGSSAEASAKKGTILLDWAKGLGSLLYKGIKYIPVIGPLVQATEDMINGKWLDATYNLVRAIPGVGIVIDILDWFTGGKTQESIKGGLAKGGIVGWVKGMAQWMSEKLRDTPIIGPAIRAAEEFSKGNWLKGLKQLVYIVPLFEIIGSMLGDKETGTVAQKTGSFLKSLGAWLGEKLKEAPIIGPAMRAADEFSKGNWLKGLKQLAYIFPPFEIIGALLGDKETGAVAQGGAGILKSIGSFLKDVRTWILRGILNLLPETILGVSIRSRAAKLLGIDMGPVTDQPQTTETSTGATQTTQPTTDSKPLKATVTVNGKTMTLDEWEAMQKTQVETQTKANQVTPASSAIETTTRMNQVVPTTSTEGIEPSKDVSSTPELQKEVGNNVVNNYAVSNDALNKIANNSDITNTNIANLVHGFNTLAIALEKLGVSIKDAPGSTTVINQGGKGDKGAVARSTEFAKVGNTTISDFRRFVESSRLVPA